MFVVVTLKLQELPVKETPFIQLIVLPELSTIAHELYVQTPIGQVK